MKRFFKNQSETSIISTSDLDFVSTNLIEITEDEYQKILKVIKRKKLLQELEDLEEGA